MLEFLRLLLAAFLGWLVNWWPQRNARRRRLSTYWTALYSEAELAIEMVQSYLKDDVIWPLYRLPTAAHRSVYPSVLAEAELTRDESRALAQFFVLVDEFNRGMERADTIAGGKPLQDERRRLLELKGPRLIAYWQGDKFDGVKHDSVEALLRKQAVLLPAP